VSRLIVTGIFVIVLILCGIGLTFAQGLTCYKLESLVSDAHADGKTVEVVSGWLAHSIAQIHKEEAPAPYSVHEPVETILLLRETDDSVVVFLQQGEFACAPLKFSPDKWRGVSMMVWGRGA
jgi:hypothetical protein